MIVINWKLGDHMLEVGAHQIDSDRKSIQIKTPTDTRLLIEQDWDVAAEL